MFHPQLPLGMPCYDFVPVTELSLNPRLVRKRTRRFDISIYRDALRLCARRESSATPGFLDVTGGEYKIRERIQRGVADPRLLAIPTSWSRVADSNLNWGAL